MANEIRIVVAVQTKNPSNSVTFYLYRLAQPSWPIGWLSHQSANQAERLLQHGISIPCSASFTSQRKRRIGFHLDSISIDPGRTWNKNAHLKKRRSKKQHKDFVVLRMSECFFFSRSSLFYLTGMEWMRIDLDGKVFKNLETGSSDAVETIDVFCGTWIRNCLALAWETTLVSTRLVSARCLSLT